LLKASMGETARPARDMSILWFLSYSSRLFKALSKKLAAARYGPCPRRVRAAHMKITGRLPGNTRG
jgi:hypothetical protein